jgi:hypothetical protein
MDTIKRRMADAEKFYKGRKPRRCLFSSQKKME